MDFEFSGWQRAVSYRYSLTPLSTLGSTIGDAGGRFNIGALDPMVFPVFPALYIAEDRVTAEQELLCQDKPDSELSNYDFALTKPQSLSVVACSGKVNEVIDLRKEGVLKRFAKLLSGFSLSSKTLRLARKVGISPRLISTESELVQALLEKRWRAFPMQFDVPSNSQVFGQLVQGAGIGGVVYPSKMSGRACIAIFTRNLEHSDSYVQLDDETPPGVTYTRLDTSNFRACE